MDRSPEYYVLRRIVKRLAQILMLCDPPPEIVPGRWYRASGECVCDVCGDEYWLHAEEPYARYLNRLCNGDVVKL